MDIIPFISEFDFYLENKHIQITKNIYGGSIIKEWVVCWIQGPLNPWYLGNDYIWRYKSYGVWKEARDALWTIKALEFSDE